MSSRKQERAVSESVTGLILAGGLARRMGGEDKGLVSLADRPMIEHVLNGLRPQVGSILISANRNLDRYAAYGCPVVPDSLEGFVGPLAGMLSALQCTTTEYVLTVPCDAPLLAADLACRLHAAAVAHDADAAVATDAERWQPVFLLLRRRMAVSLARFLGEGGRKIDAWLGQLHTVAVDFSDEADTFVNVNDPEERRRVEALVLSRAARR